MANINYSQELYTRIIEHKKELEEYISELYSGYDSFSFKDKIIAVEIIDDLKEIIFEYDKYIAAFQNISVASGSQREYVIIEGDTLPSIAAKTTGVFTNWLKIYKYNGLGDIKLIPGDILKIPEDL